MARTILSDAPVSRRWLLNGAAVWIAQLYAMTAAGALVPRMGAGGAGGAAEKPAGAVAVTAGGSAKPGQIGFNTIADNGQGASSFLYLNRMKSGGANGEWSNGAPLSAWGYPTGTVGGKDTGEYVSLRRPDSGSIDYVLRHNGVGLKWFFFGVEGVAKKNEHDPNRVIFTVAAKKGEEYCNALLVLTGAKTWPDYRPDDPVESRDGIAIYEVAEEADYLAGKQFRRKALAEGSRTFGTRWMDAQKINNSRVRTAADVTPLGHCTYSEAAPWGPPTEVMIDFANETGTHLYVCVPYLAPPAWTRAFLTTIRDRLQPGLLAFVEWGNEVWNGGGGFEKAHEFARAAAQKVDPAWSDNHGYGLLAADLALLTREVFGASHAARVVDVFARQLFVMHGAEDAAAGVASKGHAVGDLFAAMAVSFYTGGPAQAIGLPSASPVQKTLLLQEVARYEATGDKAENRTVRQALVDQLWHGNAIAGWPNEFLLDDLDRHWGDAADFCRAHGIRHLIGYEGQDPHTSFFAFGDVDGLRANRMMYAWKQDERVSGTQAGSFMRRKFEMMRSHGMTAYFILTNYGPLNQYGAWLTKPSSLSPNTRQWDFYDWYNVNAPAPLAFEIIVGGGGMALPLGKPSARVIRTFGGAIPASPVVVEKGVLPPGMKLSTDGKLTGTAMTAGSYPITCAATDACGATVRRAITLTVRAGGNAAAS